MFPYCIKRKMVRPADRFHCDACKSVYWIAERFRTPHSDWLFLYNRLDNEVYMLAGPYVLDKAFKSEVDAILDKASYCVKEVSVVSDGRPPFYPHTIDRCPYCCMPIPVANWTLDNAGYAIPVMTFHAIRENAGAPVSSPMLGESGKYWLDRLVSIFKK